MVAKTWEADFRYPAIRASIRKLSESERIDPFLHDGSFCLPVGEKPRTGWTPGILSLIAIVLGFLLLIGGVVLITAAEKADGITGTLLTVLACCSSISGILTFFIPVKMDKQLISWIIGQRGRELRGRSRGNHLLSCELSSPESANKVSIHGDDHIIICFDTERERLLIEGTSARYQIRATDVTELEPFQFMNYLGADVTFRIDDETTLRFAIAKVSLLAEFIRQAPILFFLRGRVRNKLLQVCSETLRWNDPRA